MSVRYSLYDVSSANSRGAGGLSAPSASAGLDNTDQAIAFSNTLTLGSRTVERDAGTVHPQRPAGAPDRSSWSGRQHRGRGVVRHVPVEPAGPTQHDVPGDQQRLAAARRRMRCAPAWISSTTTTASRFPRAERGSYTFSSLVQLPDRDLQQRRLLADLRRDGGRIRATPNVGLYAQDEWSATLGLTLNLGLRYDLQFLDDDRTRTATTCRLAPGSRGRRSSRGTWSCAAAPVCSSTACRCARSPTRCCRPTTPPTSTSSSR